MPCGRDLLIGLIRAQPIPSPPAVTVLGVDDFAFRRSATYGTILIDMATHRPIDLLPDREAATLAAWLVEHPGVEVVCRDRAGAYAQGIETGAPSAIQVADRYHLWKNLCEAVGKTVIAHHGCLRAAPTPPEQNNPEPEKPTPEAPPPRPSAEPAALVLPERRLVTRTRERFEAVQSRLATGMSRSAISRELNLDIQTVRRFANATDIDELLVACQNRSTNLDGYIDQVNELWNTGLYDGAEITAEITELGYTGSVQTVRRYLRAFRLPGTSRSHPDPTRRKPAPSMPAIPKSRKISRWLLSWPDHLDENDTIELKALLTRCEHLDRLHEHVRTFAAIMTGRRGGPRPLDQAAEVHTTAQVWKTLLVGTAFQDTERLTVHESLAVLLDDAVTEQKARAAEVAEYGHTNQVGVAVAGRAAAIRQHILESPAPVVADALAYHYVTTARLATETGGDWSRYAAGNHSRSPVG